MGHQQKSYKKFVATAATATLVASAIVPVASASFKDVAENNEFATYINKAVEAGYVKGYADGTFGINDNLKRSQVVIIIGRYLEKLGYTSEATTSPWSDVKDAEVIKYGNIVKDAGVFTGYANGTLNGAGLITRENMAVVLDRLAKTVTGTSLSDVAADIKDIKVADLATANVSYQASIQALRDLGISTANNFNPKGNVKRGQFAKFIVTAVEKIDAIAPEVPAVTVEDIKVEIKAVDAKLPVVANITADNAVAAKVAVEAAKTAIAAIEVKIAEAKFTAEEVAELEKAIDAVEAKYDAIVKAADKAIEDAKKLVVESVSAINANEILVTFNKEVDKESAILAANYEVELNKSTISSSNLKFALQEDKKSVLVRYIGSKPNPTAFTAGDKLVVQVKDGVKDVEGKAVERFTTETIVFAANAAPQLVGKPELTSNGLLFQFDRPVSETASTLVKVDGIALSDTRFEAADKKGNKLSASSADPTPGSYYYLVDTNNTEYNKAKVVGKHEVVIFDVYETAVNNPERASVINTEYTAAADTVAPTVVGLTAINANRFFVEFSESVTLDQSFANSITVKKGKLQFNTVTTTGPISEDTTVQTYISAPTTRDGKPGVYVSIEEGTSGTTNPLYETNESEVTLNVTVEKYKDSENLLGAKFEGTVKLAKNTASPKVLSSVVDSENLVFLFDAQLDSNSTILKGSSTSGTTKYFDIVVKDKDGIIVPNDKISSIKLDNKYPNNSNTLTDRVLTVDIDSEYEKRGPYTVTFKENAVKYALNKTIAGYNAEATQNKEFNVTVGTAADSSSKYYTGVGSVTATGNVITIPFNTDMDASARVAANYTIDGKALPTGSTVDFYENKKTVKITLPEGSLNSTTQYKLTISKDVKTAAGQIVVGDLQKLNAFESTISGLADNTRPTLASAEYYVSSNSATSSNYVLVKFSEEVKGLNVFANNDLEVNVNGNKVGVEAILNGSTTATNQDAYVILKLDTDVNVQQAATITVIPKVASDGTSVITDLQGNKLAASTVTTGGKTLDGQNNFAALEAARVAPTVTIAGQISAPKTVEYRSQGTTAWITGTGSYVTVTPGTYEYRTVAASTSNGVASEIGTVKVLAPGAVTGQTVAATKTQLDTITPDTATALTGTLATVSISGNEITLDGTSATASTGVPAFSGAEQTGKFAIFKISAPAGFTPVSATVNGSPGNALDANSTDITMLQRLYDANTVTSGWTRVGTTNVYSKTLTVVYTDGSGNTLTVNYTILSK